MAISAVKDLVSRAHEALALPDANRMLIQAGAVVAVAGVSLATSYLMNSWKEGMAAAVLGTAAAIYGLSRTGSALPDLREPEDSIAIEVHSTEEELLQNELREWAGYSNNRKEAAHRILEAFKNNATELNLRHLAIDSLPDCIGRLIHLTHLDLSENQVKKVKIPDTLTQLTTLRLYDNCLDNVEIPATLTNLTLLNLCDNQIPNIAIPATLTKLIYLNLSQNQLQHVEIPDTLINLQSLHLSENQLQHIQIPATLIHLSELYLYENQLQHIEIPATLTHLTLLNLCDNHFQNIEIPTTLVNLAHLNLFKNQLQHIEIPATLTHLTHLTLAENHLQNIQIPNTLTHLILLDLAYNQFQNIEIPTTLVHLAHLDLSDNQFQNLIIPITFTNLTYLGLSRNQFANIPASLAQLPSQCFLYLYNNLFSLPTVRLFQAQIQQANLQSHGMRGPHLQISIHDVYEDVLSLEQAMNMWIEEYQKLESHEVLVSSATVIALLTDEQQEQMKTFLTKLRNSPEYQKSPQSLVPKIYRMLSGISQSAEFRNKAFLQISDALNTCVDRAAIKLKDIDVLWDLILHPPQNEQEYALRLIGHKRLAELDKSAFWHAQGKPVDGVAISYIPPDQISTLFRFSIDGWDSLQLPPSMDHLKFNNMAYACLGHLVEPDDALSEEERSQLTTAIIRQAAETIVKDTSSPDQHLEILFGNEFGSYWTEYLERQYASEHAACFAPADKVFEAIDISPDSPGYTAALAPVMELRQKASQEWQAWMRKKTIDSISQ